MRSYEAARNLFGFLGFCAWCVIILGLIVGLIGGTAASSGFGSGPSALQALLGIAPGAVVSLAGLYGLALVQMGRTSVDSAEYGQQALDVSRQQLEVSREALAQGKTAAASYAELLKRLPASKANSKAAAIIADTDQTYGSRAEQDGQATNLGDGTEQSMIAEQASDTTPQLEHAPTIAVDDMLPKGGESTPALEVKKVGSSYVVGNKAFKTAREAHDYASTNAS